MAGAERARLDARAAQRRDRDSVRRRAAHGAPRVIDLFVDSIAAYRLTRFVTADVLTAGLRAKLIEGAYRRQARREHVTLSERAGQPIRQMRPSDWDDLAISEGECAPKLATLITCRWCAGVWIAAGVLVARRVAPRVWPVAARGLVISSASALVARIED